MKRLYCYLYAFVFMGIGVLSPLIGQYLKTIGFTGGQIGLVTASGTCMVIIASPFWGQRYSAITRRSRRYLMVALVLGAAAVTALVLSQVTVFLGVLLLFMLLYFFQSPSSALLDAMTIDDGERFGFIRTFGAAGFAVSCFVAAQLAGVWGLGMIFPTYAACFLMAACLVVMIRHRSRRNRGENEDAVEQELMEETVQVYPRGMLRSLLSNRSYVLILLSAFFINGTDIANNTFFSFLYLEGGGALAGVGIAFLLMAGSEAPFMAASDRLCERFGQGHVLLVAMVFSIVRFALFSLGPAAPILIALFPLQGLVNGITLVEFVKFVARVTQKELHGIGIATYYAVANSLSTILCQLAGGWLLDHGLLWMTGPQSVYFFFAVFNIAGVAVFLYMMITSPENVRSSRPGHPAP